MVSKNNQYWKQQRDAQRVPHYGLRKLSVGVASVLLSTTLYMGATAHADTVNSQNYEMLDSKVANNSNSSNGDSVVDRGTNSANATNTVSGDSHVDASVAETTAKNEVNTNPQITEINNGSYTQSNAANVNANVKSDVNTPSNEMFSAVATEISPVPMSPSSSSSSQGAVTAPVESEASNKTNSQTQPSSTTDTAQTKLSHRPVMRLAAVTTTNSNELIVGKDVTISDFSVTAANGKNEFENAHANIKFTMHADDPSALAGKHLTIQLDKKVWNGIDYSETKRANPITISYQGQIIGTLDYNSSSYFVRITFNNRVKDYTKINVQSDLVVSGIYQDNLPYEDYLYTPTQAKDGQTYHLTDDVVIGQQKYSSNLPSVIHYHALKSELVSSVTNETTTSYNQRNSILYTGTFYKTPNGIYYSQSSYYSSINNLYDKESGQPGELEGLSLDVGTDMIADHTRSYTATFDIDHTKLFSYSNFKLEPVESYSLAKDYFDDQNLLPNTSDVYVDYSRAYSSTTTADAKVTENSVIFNQLKGQSLATQHVSIKDSWSSYTANYISQASQLYITPALFQRLQAAAESDQNLTEAINTVTTTGRDAEIKLINPIDVGFKVTITTSDGKTKKLPLLIDTIEYPITTASTAPKGAILVAAQGKTVKIYHHGDQNIPAVVDQNKLTKTITRTINVHEPGKKVTTIKQAVVMAQSVSVIDGKDVTYNGDWKVQGNSSWARYDAPVVPGYTVNYPHVASQSVSDATEDQTIEITYAANAQTTHVSYVDAHGYVIHTTTVNGHTNQTVDVPSEIPDGWKLVDGQTVPNEITFGPDGHADMSVKIEHQQVTVQPDMPKTPSDKLPDNPNKSYPSGVAKDDLNKTVTRKVTITTPDGKSTVTNQTVTFTRNATVDEVTGNVTYGSWSKNGKHTFATVDVPNVPGYTATGDVPNLTVTPNSQDTTVTIGYTANKQSVNVNYVDVNDGNKVVHTTTVNGVTDGDSVVSNELPDGYKLVDGQSIPKTIHFNADNNDDINIKVQHSVVTVTSDSPKTPSDKLPDNPNKTYPSGVSENDLNKAITRTIKVTTPDGQTKTVAQTVKLTRTATVDEVTGEVTYGKWSTDQWDAYDVPSLNGYTATQTEISATPVDENTKNQTVDVSYTPNKQSTTIKYVDNKGETVYTTTVNGATDQTVKVSSEVPAGWTITKGQVPSEITFGADGHEPIEVTVAHQHVTVVPDNPQNNGTKLPDNPAKTFNGVEANDLNKTITRTIKVTTPDGQTKTVEQAVHLTRTADVDEVTSEVTYGKWTTGEWANYDVPSVAGYTASQNEVPTAKVTGDTKDQTVTVTYNADQQNLIVNFIDDTTGQTLKTVNKDGLTNSNSNYNTKSDIQNYVNNHYRLVSDDTNGQNLVFDNDDSKTQTYNVHLAHNTHDINDSNTVTETIHYKLDNGQKAFDDYNVQLSFTRTGYNDEVTGQNHWNDWQATNGQTFNAVQSPIKEGYTPDKTSIEAVNVKPGDKNIDTTVTYNANAQAAKISYIDDNTGATLKTDNANGKFNQAISFDNNVDNQIKDYEQQGYVLKSNSFSNQAYQADNAKNVFEVHLIHGTKNVQRNDTINETVQYQMEDGTKAPVTNSQSTSFTQDGVQDLVTNNIDWKVIEPHQFKEVITPVMTGYTPDIASVPATTVNFGDKDISKIVTYKANAQTAKISYIDDNTGATLKTDNANGKFNQAISFGDVDGAIKDFEDKGYQLKSNSFKGQKYQADNNSNVFEVHLIHGTKNVQRTQKITETINYQMDDGSKALAANTQSVDFTQDGVQDLVTNNIDWKATEPQQFKAVNMPTVNGYTPDITSVPATTVNFGDKDINKTVTYKANPQDATINYIDDTTGKTIKTDNANGKFNQPISFDNNVDNQIKAFENQGYVLKSNSFNGQKYQADNDKNVFEVHLVHGTKNVQRTQKITETVNYQMDDGSQAPSTNTQSVNFTQNGVQDLVTNNIDWKATDPQQFKAVNSPALTGYTPDITSVPAMTVNFGDKDINKTVTYKANPQSAKITYIDDNTGKTLKVDDTNGKFNQVIDFANMNGDIKDFENQGYVLKSNSFNGQNYQADNAKNTFEVHFIHGTKNVQRQDTITETVKYQYDNGTPARENNVQTLNFTQDGVQDLVTKNIDWKPTDAQEFKQVDTPTMDGYTPDITSISATKVNFGDSDINKVVTYQANNQTANIYYVDDMTGSLIGNGTTNGKFGTVIDFGNVNDKINTFKSLGYQLVSNGFNGQTYQSDNSKNVYYVHFTHGIKNIQRNKQITETIKYQYENGQQAQPDSVQTVSFNENGSQDLVTKKINWFNDTPQQFKAVSTPVITGYTADIDNIPAVVVDYDNDNINKVVTYKANSQTAKINYIDDTTGKVIKTDTANGKLTQAISFSETPTNVVNGLIKRGYKLVSNSFNGQTYQSDNSKNEFTVHLAHNTKNVSKQNTVTRTINYLDNNGKAIQTPTVETVTFTQNGITDLVTGNTTWNTPSSQTFEAVTSPTIKGFGKPDVEVVQPQTVNFNDQNVVVNVHYPKATTPTNVNNNTGKKINDNITTPTVDHDKGKLNPTTFTTTAHQTTPQAYTANSGSQQSITPQSVNKPSEQPTVANNGTKADTLPQTGNSNDNSSAIVGLGLLSGMLGLLGIKGKKKQD